MFYYNTRKLARQASQLYGKPVVDNGSGAEKRWSIKFL